MLRKNLRDAFWKAVVCAALLEFHLILVALYYPDFAEKVARAVASGDLQLLPKSSQASPLMPAL